MKNNWKIAKPIEEYTEYDSITDKILKIRGIEDKDRFINPREDDINDPYNLSNMELAVDKIANTIENNLSVGIYADIDCDGVTSATIMYKCLKNHGIKSQLLYHQKKQGHGVIVNNVPKEIDLLIIVDSSSNSIKECEELNSDMDIIILDHHPMTENNSYAIVVNPQCNDYSNKFLSGAGVVYQTCKAIDDRLFTSFADEYTDICAVGLLGDMMNIVEPETRALIQKGMNKIHNDCDMNLKLILKHLKKDYKPTTTDISFYLVPFINAVIRLGKIENILEILTSNNEENVKKLIKSCSDINDKRKTIQGNVIEEIDKMINLNHKIIIVDVTDLKSPISLNGLIANNIAQKYQKPTLVVSLDKDTNTLCGSGRNYGNAFDFKEILSATKLFELVEG